jgi:GntR family transcriptional regulator
MSSIDATSWLPRPPSSRGMNTTLPPSELNRDSDTPMHLQLRRLLHEAIVAGQFEPGDTLPAEMALAGQFRVSRATVRQALDSLERDRLIEKRKGSGSFVLRRPAPAWLLQSTGGFFDDPERRVGPNVRSVVLRAQVEPLPEWAAAALNLPVSSHGVTLERLRWVAGRLATYSLTHCPDGFATQVLSPGLERESLYERLARLGLIEVRGGRRILEAVAADDRIASLLRISSGAPVQFVESVSWDAQLNPFACHRAWVRTDHLQIEVLYGDGAGDVPALELDLRGTPGTLVGER